MIDELFKELEGGGAISTPVTQTAPKKKALDKVVEPQKVYNTYEDFEYEDLLTYAGLDCIVTSSVLAELFPKLIEEPTYNIVGSDGKPLESRAPAVIKSVTEVEMIAHEYIVDLEINGLKYNVERNQEFSRRMVSEVAELEESIFRVTGRLNWNSGPEVQDLLYNRMGLTPPYMTKGNEPSTDGDALLTLAGIDPMSFNYTAPDPSLQWLSDFAKMKDINSAHNTFIKTYVKDFVKRDGRIHPSYNLHGTSSFRITGSEPNLTQIPRPRHGYNIRECYEVDQGNIFIAADWSSAEVKVLGAISKDKALLSAIEKGYDFHSFSASQILGVSYEEYMGVLGERNNPLYKHYKDSRQASKALTFGIDTGTCV